jgi:integrase
VIVHDHAETPSAITLKPASAIAEMRSCPQFLVQAMQRGLATEALRPDCWSRIFRCDLLSLPVQDRLPGEPVAPQTDVPELTAPEPGQEVAHESASVSGSSEEADREIDPLIDDVVAAHPWLADLNVLLDTDDTSRAAEALDQLRLRLEGQPTAQLYVGWLATNIDQGSSSAPDLTVRTARGVSRNLLRLVPHLLKEFGGTWPGVIDPQERRDRLHMLMYEAGDEVASRDLAAMVSNLENLLSDGAETQRAWYDDEGIDGDDGPRVDARILTLDHFEGALELARLGVEPAIPPDEREVLLVAMTLAGRSGLRPTEWIGLRLVDLTDVKGLELLVRPHAERPLKSDNAERRVPLSSFLTSKERHLIRRWLGRRRAEVQHLSDEERQRAPLLHLGKWPDAQARAKVLLRHINVLLRQATGDPSIRPYALRHMFCSWTCLALSAAESLALPALLNQWPATVAWLRRGRRMQQHLLARHSGPERRSLYLLCRLMGHLSPAITLAHYTHIVDLLQFEAVQQHCPELQRGVLVAASGLPKSTAHDRLARSLGSLVEATREATMAKLVPMQPPWPVHDPLEMSSPRWNRDKVRSVLAAYLESGQPAATIADCFGITPDQLDRMVRTSAELGPLFGEPLQAALAPNLGTTCCPPRGRLGVSQRAMANELFDSAHELFKRDARLCMMGVRLHLQHYTKDVHDIAFTEPDPLRTYVEFLRALGIEPARVRVCLRRANALDHDLPAWACDQLGPYGSSLIWCIRPRSLESAVGYSRWLGLKIFDSDGQGCGIWLARTLMYAEIAREAISAGPKSRGPLTATSR